MGGGHPWSLVTADLEALLTALYVLIDDHIIESGARRPGRPKKLSDAELVCLAVAQVLLGARSCTAVGGYSTPTSGASLLMAEVWDGSSWSVQRAVTPTGADSSLASVACSAPGVCTAVGSTTTKVDNLGESASKTLGEAEP
jgi:hypothetical protein